MADVDPVLLGAVVAWLCLYIFASLQDVIYALIRGLIAHAVLAIVLWPIYSAKWSDRLDYPRSDLFWTIKCFALTPIILALFTLFVALTHGVALLLLLPLWGLALEAPGFKR